MNSNCLLSPHALIGPYHDDLISNVVYNSCKNFLLKDVKDSYVANELDNHIKNSVNSVNESKLLNIENKIELKSKKKHHRKRKKKTKVETQNESEESDSEKENETEPYVHIKLTDEKVEEYIKKFNIKPGSSLRFGKNRIIVSDKITTDERSRMELVNIFWMSTLIEEDEVELSTIVGIKAAQMYVIFQQGVEIYENMKYKDYVDQHLDDEITVIKKNGDFENKLKDAEKISSFIEKTDFSQLVIITEKFGKIDVPSNEELDFFAGNFRLCKSL
jgi:hypothetical protein